MVNLLPIKPLKVYIASGSTLMLGKADKGRKPRPRVRNDGEAQVSRHQRS